MFKGTNKMWKVVALALVLCMLPMAAFASASTVTITTSADDAAASYNANGSVTIAGTTTAETVTILAVCGAGEVAEANLNTADVLAKVVYAGQQAASQGAFSFSFVPKADVAGDTMTVFVGGKGVSTLAKLSFSVKDPAPAITPVWYNGEGEKLTLMLANVTGEAAAAWYTAIDSFTINGVEIPANKRTPNEGYTEIVIEEVEGVAAPITSVVITDADDVYAAVNTGTINVVKTDKTAGAITVTYPTSTDYFVAGTSLTTGIKAENTGAHGEAWEAALTAKTATVTFDGNAVADYTYDATSKALVLTLTIANDVAEATGTLKIAVGGYIDTTASVKLVAPTTLDGKALEGTTLGEPLPTGEENALTGAYHVVLPTITPAYDTVLKWYVKVDAGEFVDAASYITEGKFDLTRDASADKTYTLKAAVTKDGYKAVEKVYDAITIKKLGSSAFGDISSVEILKGEANVAGTEVTYADALALTAKAVGTEGVQATYVWAIGETTVSTEATYAPTKADISKTITVTATPAGEFKGDAVSATVTIVLDATYVPAPTVAFKGTKLTAGGTAAAVATLDETYADAPGYTVGEPVYTYYEVLAADANSEEAAIAKVKAGMEAKEDAKYAKAGSYAVVKAAVTYSIAGKDFGTIEAYDAMVVSKKSVGGTVGGTTLPGAEKPSTPVTPDKPVDDDPVSGDPVANGAAAFTDVDKTTYAWAYDSIDVLAKAGVFKGITPTTFGPELETTNTQVIALAVRIAGLKADNAKTDLIDEAHWAYAEVAVAAANDILGVFGDKIDAEGATTREVAFALLYNALKAAGVEIPEVADAIEYTDASSIDAACVEAITALTKAGIVNGMGDGTLAPKATITRAQLAKILGLAKALIK